MAVTEELLARMAEAVRPAGADMAVEAEYAWDAANRLAPGAWRELYLAHFAKAHPAPDPIEEGVLQPGDKVMFIATQGGQQGTGTLVRAYDEQVCGRPITMLQYELDVPYRDPRDGSEKLGGLTNVGSLVHVRDWPRTMLGEITLGRGMRIKLGEVADSPPVMRF